MLNQEKIINWQEIALSETGLAQLKLEFNSKTGGLKDLLTVYKIWVKKINLEIGVIQTRVLYKYLDKWNNENIWNSIFIFYLDSETWYYYYGSGNKAVLDDELPDDNYELVYKDDKVFSTESATQKPVKSDSLVQVEKPGQIKKTVDIETPIVIEKPVDIETPIVIEKPVDIETPSVIEKPVQLEKPVDIETPVVTKSKKKINYFWYIIVLIILILILLLIIIYKYII